MKEVNGVRVFEGYDNPIKVKARSEHGCDLCGNSISAGETYYRYVEKETGYERKACFKHIDAEETIRFDTRRVAYVETKRQGVEVMLETDASGIERYRWAFIAYLNGREVYRKHDYTPREVHDITPAEGYAVLMAIRWLAQAEARGDIEINLPVVIGSDNDAVHIKLSTQSERGKYSELWHDLNQALLPYRKEGRLFVEGRDCSAAHNYASKEAFEADGLG
jgi:hypothetical protein